MPGNNSQIRPSAAIRTPGMATAGRTSHLGFRSAQKSPTIHVSSGFIRGIPVNCCTHPRAVIARSNATKQSRVSSIKTGLLCCARNDENVYAASERRKPSHIAVAEPESSTRT